MAAELRPAGPVFLACNNLDPDPPAWPGIDECHEWLGAKGVDVLTGLLVRNEKNFRPTAEITHIRGRWIEPATPTGARRQI